MRDTRTEPMATAPATRPGRPERPSAQTAQANAAPASLAPASVAPASVTPASVAPASVVPADTAPDRPAEPRRAETAAQASARTTGTAHAKEAAETAGTAAGARAPLAVGHGGGARAVLTRVRRAAVTATGHGQGQGHAHEHAHEHGHAHEHAHEHGHGHAHEHGHGRSRGDGHASRPRRRVPRLGPGRSVPFGRLIGPALLVAVWWGASALGWLDPRILSGPGDVLATARDLVVQGRLQSNVLVSLERAGLGLVTGVAAGVLLAVVAGLSRTGEYLVDGPLQIKRAIPSLALLPLLILWLGIGESMKVTVIALGVAVSVYVNAYASLTSIDGRYLELARVLRLGRWRFVVTVVLPGALPGFFVGLRLGVTSSWLGLVVVEQINATSGIGYMMFQAQQYAQSDVIIVGLVVYGVFGYVSDAAVRAVERRALSWRRTLAS